MAVKGSEGTINLSIFFVTTILTTTEPALLLSPLRLAHQGCWSAAFVVPADSDSVASGRSRIKCIHLGCRIFHEAHS